MRKLKCFSIAFYCLLSLSTVFAQDKPQKEWFNDDFDQTGRYGVSTEKAYELLKAKTPQQVIVAVIDGGVDPMHEDLKEVMWKNPGEIANNGKDDDNNGYVDDVYGWNFAGGKDGKSVDQDTHEETRLYAKYRDKFKEVDPSKLKGKEKEQYALYKEVKERVESQRTDANMQAMQMNMFMEGMKSIRSQFPEGEEITNEKLENMKVQGPQAQGLMMLKGIIKQTGMSFAELEKEIQTGLDQFKGMAEYGYNPDFRPRAKIVGDDYMNWKERDYGNNDVKGPDAFHGTHVAGIIAADRDNGLGIQGVAEHVAIMGVRAVPNGDERDKDVANAIRYAVDNGAKVINMSFGKDYSWNKKAVDKAVKYARKKDVLLVHAAGNSAQNNDEVNNFPNDAYEKRGIFGAKKADNWLEVGAASWKTGDEFIATFSNYGKNEVDVFAPGVDIYSTAPDGGYEYASGTSMASPVTAGVAALIRAYFPKLKAKEVKEIIMQSVTPITVKAVKPGSNGSQVNLSEVSVTGGTVNAARAVELAMKRSN